MRIPLRLAITDQVDEEEEGEAAQQERQQPWSVRLAGRLLDKAAKGDACPWAPYLAVSWPRRPVWIPVVTGPLCGCSTCCLALAAAFWYVNLVGLCGSRGFCHASCPARLMALWSSMRTTPRLPPLPAPLLPLLALQVLPQHVPSPLTAFSWEDVQALEVGLLDPGGEGCQQQPQAGRRL